MDLPLCRPSGHRHGALHAAQGLEGVDHWGKPPGLPLRVTFLFQTCKPFGGFGDGADVFLEHELLGWARPPRCTPSGARAPRGLGLSSGYPAAAGMLCAEIWPL
jgi:hypothetical protein